ncbi:hypothetical protein LshimejAT787_0801180 [Lyophyllum shimeji]|uniref:Uncharacterized protein n=1 Tax=Lyophyllum shimeji TaxID=47721 RepID=A0A9P3PRW2_LYOSH|nr:hypothetical protein LshimejAT787_0801180 [Lyophyllum shimeji]
MTIPSDKASGSQRTDKSRAATVHPILCGFSNCEPFQNSQLHSDSNAAWAMCIARQHPFVFPDWPTLACTTNFCCFFRV